MSLPLVKRSFCASCTLCHPILARGSDWRLQSRVVLNGCALLAVSAFPKVAATAIDPKLPLGGQRHSRD